MIEQSIAKRYARALISVATQSSKNDIDVYGQQIDLFDKTCRDNPILLSTLSERYFDMFARERVIDNLAQKMALADAVRNFLKLLVRKGRIELLHEINLAYAALAHDMMGREVMTVVSAVTLKDEQYASLESVFSRKTGKKMVVERKNSPDVLGGVRVHIRDTVYDYTVKNQLEQMRQKLLA